MLVVASTQSEALGLVSVARYRELVGDETSSAFKITTAITDALYLVEEYLRRKLMLGEYAETLTPYNGLLYPSVTPIAEVDDVSAIVGDAITAPFFRYAGPVSITYRGGYTAQTLPRTIQLAIVQTAQSLLSGAVSQTDAPYGAKSLSVGDVSVTFSDDGAGVGVGGLPTRIARSLKRYQVRYV